MPDGDGKSQRSNQKFGVKTRYDYLLLFAKINAPKGKMDGHNRIIAAEGYMRTGRILHLIDFIKLAERASPGEQEPSRVRLRNPDEEIRVAPWRQLHPYTGIRFEPGSSRTGY